MMPFQHAFNRVDPPILGGMTKVAHGRYEITLSECLGRALKQNRMEKHNYNVCQNNYDEDRWKRDAHNPTPHSPICLG